MLAHCGACPLVQCAMISGSNIIGCDLGFTELLRQGEINKLPRLFCVQPLVCSPIASAILAAQGRDDGKRVPTEWNVPVKTCAEGTSIASPLRLKECVDAVLRSNGSAVRVCEADIQRATKELARIGLYTEPTCAQAGAAYHELLAGGMVKAGEITVIVLTSTGIKATPTIASFLGVEL